MIQFQKNTWTNRRVEGQKDGRRDRHYFVGPLWLPLEVPKTIFHHIKRFLVTLFFSAFSVLHDLFDLHKKGSGIA